MLIYFKVTLIYIILIYSLVLSANDPQNTWKKIDKGLYWGIFDSPQKAELGDSKITIVKIDPNYYSFKLLSASEHNNERLTTKDWSKKFNLIGTVNAGMFQKDLITHVGYMKNSQHINNPNLMNDKAVLGFNASDSTVPEIQIIDRECQDFNTLKKKYNTLIQNIRVVDCNQKNVWRQQDKKWSMIVLGIDKNGNVLFIFCRSPYSVHDFINILFTLPISLYNAMYLEGGPEASMYLSSLYIELNLSGSFETGFTTTNAFSVPLPIPNVIGFVKKETVKD